MRTDGFVEAIWWSKNALTSKVAYSQEFTKWNRWGTLVLNWIIELRKLQSAWKYATDLDFLHSNLISLVLKIYRVFLLHIDADVVVVYLWNVANANAIFSVTQLAQADSMAKWHRSVREHERKMREREGEREVGNNCDHKRTKEIKQERGRRPG